MEFERLLEVLDFRSIAGQGREDFSQFLPKKGSENISSLRGVSPALSSRI
jgi:hypothetical protein